MTAAIDISAAALAAAARPLTGGPGDYDALMNLVGDARFVLIGVEIHAASFLDLDRPQPVVLFEVVKGWVTGDTPDLGEVQRIER